MAFYLTIAPAIKSNHNRPFELFFSLRVTSDSPQKSTSSNLNIYRLAPRLTVDAVMKVFQQPLLKVLFKSWEC